MSSLTYPLTIVNGTLQLENDAVAIIGQAIKSAILTLELERVLRPYYGRTRQVFTTFTSTSQVLNEVRLWVDTGLVGYEPIELSIRGEIREGQGLVGISIVYAVIGTQLKGTLSYSLDQLVGRSQ